MALKDTTKSWLRGLFGVHNTSTVDVEDAVNRLYRYNVGAQYASSENAATNASTAHFYTAKTACKVVGASYLTDSAAVADNTNYATLRVLKGNGAAAATTVVANVATTETSGNIAAGVPYALTLQPANVELDAGDTLAFNLGKAGTGLDVPAGYFSIEIEQI